MKDDEAKTIVWEMSPGGPIFWEVSPVVLLYTHLLAVCEQMLSLR